MFELTACRCGDFNHTNRQNKGCFRKKFKSLDDFARYLTYNNNGKLCFPYTQSELTKQQRNMLYRKVVSLEIHHK